MTQQTGIIGDNARVEGGIHFHNHAAAPPIIPRQLPTLEQCFLHRDEELVWLNERLQPGAVVAVCGPGGMGKSALAAQAVSKLENARFPDGIVFHSFYHQPKVETALQEISKAFGQEPTPPLDTTLRRVLSGRKALLILDGAEEADDLPAMLRLRGQCGVLITSRKTEDAPDELLELKRLEKSQAAEVFLRYSGPMNDMASVQGICTIIGGWPVALRIAGRYLRRTKECAADYLEWLEHEPFKELATGKHQEENAALLLRRSVDAVSADARLALGVAGCLAFAPIARAPVAFMLENDVRRTRNALNGLVNYGLLEKREERWQISHALVHSYASSELALSKEELERLSGYYITFCETQSAAGVKGYAILDRDRMHYLRLMESCLNNGLWKNVQALERAIYIYLDRQGHWIDQIAAYEMRLTAAKQTGDRNDEGLFLNILGRIYNCRGYHEKALACCMQSLAIRRETSDRQGEARNLNNIAKIYATQGKHEQALNYYKQSLSIAREFGDRKGEGWTLNNTGQLYYHQDDYEQALQHYEQSLSLRREIGDDVGIGQTLNNIAVIYRAQGNPAKALKYHEQALAICQQLGDRAGEVWTRWNFGRVYEDLGDLTQAEEHISLAVQIAEQIGHPSLEKWCDGLARLRAARRGQSPCHSEQSEESPATRL